MVERRPPTTVFHALANDTRLGMVEQLAARDLTIGELAAPLDMSFAAASKHVKVLEGAGLVERTVIGREHRCRLATEPLTSAGAWIASTERYWSHRLDALERVLTTPAKDTR